MLRRHVILCGIVALTSGSATLGLAQERQPQKRKEFVDLLATGDLSQHFQTTGNWSLSKDGVAHLQPRPGEKGWERYDAYLWLKRPCKDFECEFEYKHNKGGNSGFYFNVADRKEPVTTGIELQILDSAGTQRPFHAHDCGGILPGVAPKEISAKPGGEWNHFHVTSIGGEITVRLNGVLVNQVSLDHPELRNSPKQGAVGFQDHGLPFWLRKVRIRDVESSQNSVVRWNVRKWPSDGRLPRLEISLI